MGGVLSKGVAVLWKIAASVVQAAVAKLCQAVMNWVNSWTKTRIENSPAMQSALNQAPPRVQEVTGLKSDQQGLQQKIDTYSEEERRQADAILASS